MFTYCHNNPVKHYDPTGCYTITVPILTRGLNLPSGQGIPVELNGTTYYYYSIVNRGGYLYEYWYDANGNLIWIRHHTDHNAPWAHTNPHDHKGSKDDNGYNTEETKPLPPNDDFQSPQKMESILPEISVGLGYVTAGVAIGFLVYQAVKWGGATLLAPVSGGTSYVIAAILP